MQLNDLTTVRLSDLTMAYATNNSKWFQGNRPVFDFSSRVDFGRSGAPAAPQGAADAHGTNRLCATAGLPAPARIRQVRAAVPRQTPRAPVLLFRSVPLHGLRPAHVSGEPAGHRDVSARPAA